MHPYKTYRYPIELLSKTDNGICPHCKSETGWHVHKIGVIPNWQDPIMEQPDATANASLATQGYTAAATIEIPCILHNTCMKCQGVFYDYAYQLPGNCNNAYGKHRLHPYQLPAHLPQPNPDLPESCRDIFIEAVHVFEHSPRAAAALLRLCLQQLLEHLGYSGTINSMIKETVAKGVPVHIQQFMDYARHHGNAAAHGYDLTIDPEERRDNAEFMFTVVNTVAEHLITHPRQARENYAKLPESIRAQIAKRDTPNN